MPATDAITQDRLKELLSYDTETGLFTWLIRTSYRIQVGNVAGCLNDGYIKIRLDGVKYQAHRLAFLYMLGWMPKQVDHDDQIRDNNRWKNLNPATNIINMKNKSLYCNNASGHCGVGWDKSCNSWQARITVNDKIIHLGHFADKSDAIAARQVADIEYGFHGNHGNDKAINYQRESSK